MNSEILKQDWQEILSCGLEFKKMRNKKILISGANGFLPAYLINFLLFLSRAQNLNLKIIGFVRNLDKANTRFGLSQTVQHADLILLQQDISQPISEENLKQLAGPIDYIIHAASQASPKYYGVDPVGTLSANTLGTYYLLELAREKKPECFLFFSSGEVYGQVPDDLIPIKETSFGYIDCMNVRSCYGESKRLAETMCVSYFHQYGVKAKVVRPFHTYGPGMSLDDGRVFCDFVSDILNNRDIVMKSEGHMIRSYCYLSDATEGFLTVILKGLPAEVYNVGNPNAEVSVLELAQRLVQLFPDKKLKINKINRQQQENYLQSPILRNTPDIEKINKLGWQPRHSIESGFKRTIESFL
jgi:nucleoside-diphosphate-sugar epimerase